MDNAATIGDLALQAAAVMAVLLAVIALWPMRGLHRVRKSQAVQAKNQAAALAAQSKEMAARLALQDGRIATAIDAMSAALDAVRANQDDARRNHDGMHTLNVQIVELRADLARVHRIHPPEQHPHTQVALAEITRRLDDIDDKIATVIQLRRAARLPPGRN
jgi:hypothetical protein